MPWLTIEPEKDGYRRVDLGLMANPRYGLVVKLTRTEVAVRLPKHHFWAGRGERGYASPSVILYHFEQPLVGELSQRWEMVKVVRVSETPITRKKGP